MGNFDGNTAVESGRSSSRDFLGRNLFFAAGSRGDDAFSKQLQSSMDQIASGSLMNPIYNSMKVRGQVIAIPTTHCSKVPDVVDLRVERSQSITEEGEAFSRSKDEINGKASPVSSCSSDGEESATALKFGIDSLLKPDNSDEKHKIAKKRCSNQSDDLIESFALAKKMSFHRVYENSKPENLAADAETNRKQLITQTSRESVGKIRSQVLHPNKRDTFHLKHHMRSNRMHPYSKSLYERSQSDPARGNNSPLYNRFRRKSESPYNTHSKPCSPIDRIPSLPHSRHDDVRRPSSSHDASTSQIPNDVSFYPAEYRSRLGLNPHHSDSDEVFKEEAERDSSAMVFAELMKQRSLILDKSYPLPTSPELLQSMNKQKYNQLNYFSPFNHSLPGIPPTSPPGFNFQAIPGMPGNNHPMFSSPFNPYVYNPSAAAAFAIMRSLKNASSLPMMATSPQMVGSSSKSHFTFSGPNSDFQQSDNKKGSGPNKRRKWTRAVFSVLQRRALEDSFKGQKYVAKPERRFLAERLGLTDAQVKIWFQNRRMKWRQEQKSKHGTSSSDLLPASGEENFQQNQDQI